MQRAISRTTGSRCVFSDYACGTQRLERLLTLWIILKLCVVICLNVEVVSLADAGPFKQSGSLWLDIVLN